MKKLFAMIAAMAVISSASAQVVANYDFEDGTNKGWSVWGGKTNEIVQGEGVKAGTYAMEVATGTSFAFNSKAPKQTYKVTADVFSKFGNIEGYLKVFYYDKANNKMIPFEPVELSKEKGFSQVSHTFKAKEMGQYRVQFYGKKGRFILDNVKVELVSK